MSKDVKGKTIDTEDLQPSKDGVPVSKLSRSKSGKVTSRVKGEKETDVAIAGLQGEGYPSPVAFNDSKISSGSH